MVTYLTSEQIIRSNKRTVKVNGWDITSNDLYNFTMAVASGEQDLDEVRAWFATNAMEGSANS